MVILKQQIKKIQVKNKLDIGLPNSHFVNSRSFYNLCLYVLSLMIALMVIP